MATGKVSLKLIQPIQTESIENFPFNFKNLLGSRRSDDSALRRQISMSLDSSYSPISPIDSCVHGTLKKPQSVAVLQKTQHNSAEMFDDQKNSKSDSSMAGSLSLQSKASSQTSKKITRRPRSTDIVKSPQVGGSSGKKSDRMTQTMRHSSNTSTSKSPFISSNSQSIIQFCMENARSDIALRIVQRMAHKRDDFAQFYTNLSTEQSTELVMGLKKFLNDIIREISSMYGVEQARKRSLGFKADFFSVLADALTTECVFLDGAAHQPTETIEAWATLAELMFTSVRDGYYMETRQLRRNWQNFHSQSNLSSQSDQSLDCDSPHSLPSLNHMFTTV